jgi:hypothetical protein
LATTFAFILSRLASVFSWLAFIMVIMYFSVPRSHPSVDPSHP